MDVPQIHAGAVRFLIKKLIKYLIHMLMVCKIAGYYWVKSNVRSTVPRTAVRGGTDQDGSEIYVGRAYHDGDWIPAKVIPRKRVAYVPYGGKEHAKSEYEV